MLTTMHAIRTITDPEGLAAYETWLRSQPNASLWQSPQWAAYQRALGRQTKIYVAEQAGTIVASALIVIDRTTGGFSTWECPRGPLWDEQVAGSDKRIAELLETIIRDAKNERCITIFFSSATALPASRYPLATSIRHEQPQATLVLDLSMSEEALLAQMHQKGRYNIKLAQRNGVEVRQSQDIDAFYALLRSTGNRDGFTIGPVSRYNAFLQSLDQSYLLMAYHDNTPIAGLLGVRWGTTGIYYYGASSYEHRQLMAPYALQWEAMKRCKMQGCTQYDLLGIDPPGHTSAWAGVSDFKRKFGGELVEYPAEQMVVTQQWIYWALGLKRKIVG